MGWMPCCCATGIDCSPCCSNARDTASIDWPGGLTARVDCDGCDKIPAGDYDALAETNFAPFGPGCYWIDQLGSGGLYPDCVDGLIFGTDPAAPSPEATFLAVLIHDLIASKCYIAVAVSVAITSAETGGGNTVNFLAGALYVSDQHSEANYFCSGEFPLKFCASDPGYHDGNGNLLWTEPNWGDPFVTTDFSPYTGGCDGLFPDTLTVTF